MICVVLSPRAGWLHQKTIDWNGRRANLN